MNNPFRTYDSLVSEVNKEAIDSYIVSYLFVLPMTVCIYLYDQDVKVLSELLKAITPSAFKLAILLFFYLIACVLFIILHYFKIKLLKKLEKPLRMAGSLISGVYCTIGGVFLALIVLWFILERKTMTPEVLFYPFLLAVLSPMAAGALSGFLSHLYNINNYGSKPLTRKLL